MAIPGSTKTASYADIYDDIMDVRMVADYLHVSPSKIYELAKKREIPCNKATGKWLFPKQLVLEWQINESLKYGSEQEEEK